MKKLFTTFLLSIIYLSAFSGGYPFWAYFHSYYHPLKRHDGFIVTKNTDTLKGIIKLEVLNQKQNGILITQKGENKFYSLSDIKFVRLFSKDSSLIKTEYTDFEVFGIKPKLWRVLAKDKITVYDELHYTDEYIGALGGQISIIENDKLISSFNPWCLTNKGNLTSFVNKRYHKHYKSKDFKSTKELVNYIAANG